MISILQYILLGIILISCILPLLDGLVALILTILETAKGYFSVKIAQYNKTLQEINSGNEVNEDLHIAGFYNTEDEDDEL